LSNPGTRPPLLVSKPLVVLAEIVDIVLVLDGLAPFRGPRAALAFHSARNVRILQYSYLNVNIEHTTYDMAMFELTAYISMPCVEYSLPE
jgi:hypothetical protein